MNTEDILINICYYDVDGEIHFTSEFINLTKDIPDRRSLACALTNWWHLENIPSLLNYFGPLDQDDVYDGIDGHAMGIDPDICELMEYKDAAGVDESPHSGLSAEWYRDLLTAKLVSIKLPERLIQDYVAAVNQSKGV